MWSFFKGPLPRDLPYRKLLTPPPEDKTESPPASPVPLSINTPPPAKKHKFQPTGILFLSFLFLGFLLHSRYLDEVRSLFLSQTLIQGKVII